ncbi:PQQ-binding-like beta-propeller repeat protein, partial [bacterium]|nr:PQQ-binding-like beta-propeller repeat protein [bacterium]
MIGRKRFPTLLLASAWVCGLAATAGALGADWPMWRHDANRSAASPAALPAQLHLQWSRELAPPRPAFPNDPRQCFDGSVEPVVMGKTVFVPSMVSDSVTALDTESGAVRWTFFADGPVRFAPVASQGKVYCVSDDGHLYCLDAVSGRVRWKFRGLPAGRSDRTVLGNERLVSLWPARGGPVLADGTVYF